MNAGLVETASRRNNTKFARFGAMASGIAVAVAALSVCSATAASAHQDSPNKPQLADGPQRPKTVLVVDGPQRPKTVLEADSPQHPRLAGAKWPLV